MDVLYPKHTKTVKYIYNLHLNRTPSTSNILFIAKIWVVWQNFLLLSSAIKMQEKYENQSLSYTLHYDGISLESSIGTYSCRLSNIPANLGYLASFIGLGIPAFLNGVNTSNFFWLNSGQNQYIFKKIDDYYNSKLVHVWQMILEKNPCNFSKTYKFSNSEAYGHSPSFIYQQTSRNLTWNGYIYNQIVRWSDAELFQRWLDPVDKTFEECISSLVELTTNRLNQTEISNSLINNSSIFSNTLAVSGTIVSSIIGVGIANHYYGFFNKKNTAPEPVIPTDILGKSRAKKPLFSERLEALDLDQDIPEKYCCPITRDIMEDPILLDDGHFYDRSSVVNLIKTHQNSKLKCPLDLRVDLAIRFYPTAITLQNEIEEFVDSLVANAEPDHTQFTSS